MKKGHGERKGFGLCYGKVHVWGQLTRVISVGPWGRPLSVFFRPWNFRGRGDAGHFSFLIAPASSQMRGAQGRPLSASADASAAQNTLHAKVAPVGGLSVLTLPNPLLMSYWSIVVVSKTN